MATDIVDGPWHVSGAMQPLPASTFGSGGVPDPNPDASPSLFYQGTGIPDPRLVYLKDKVAGYTGVVQAFLSQPWLKSIGQIPAALATNNIAAAQNVVSGTAMTLTTASTGVTRNVPIRPFGASLNSNPATTASVALDFGFAFANCTSGSPTITVNNTASFFAGMPLVIGGVGNSAGTSCLLTNAQTIVDTTTITLPSSAVPLATNATAPIGAGDLWGPSPNGFPLPTAACPFLGGGPGLFLDPRQTVNRAISITGAAGSTGGTFSVAGWDIYGVPMTETVTVGAATIGYGVKGFKYLASVTPLFTDAHNYSVGTSDVFSFAHRARQWEMTEVRWDAALMVNSTGMTNAASLSTQTATSADPRGTIQLSTGGGGTGITGNPSNGTIVSLIMSGRRLDMNVRVNPIEMLTAIPTNAATLFGATQA